MKQDNYSLLLKLLELVQDIDITPVFERLEKQDRKADCTDFVPALLLL